MEYQITNEGGFTVLALAGEVDLLYSPQSRKQILGCLGSNANLLVDLSAVEYIDSSGIANLVEGYQMAKSKDLKFGLIGVSDAVIQVLQLARLDKVFPIFASVDEATKSLSQSPG